MVDWICEMDRFKEQLKKQVKFLLNSCALFDKGDMEEAIRIATCVRILIHDTRKSISLLKHLNAKDIVLFSTIRHFPEGKDGYHCITVFSLGKLILSKDKMGYIPNLEDFKAGTSLVLPVDEWWEQIVWILSPECKLSRKRIILSAANQDGGAHVDFKFSYDYERLTQYSAGTISAKMGDNISTHKIVDMHLISIRTIANEILKSPEFLNLLK
jgi:hypothetical protein